MMNIIDTNKVDNERETRTWNAISLDLFNYRSVKCEEKHF